MAYDKVVDSSVLNAGMTATANAIREKTGGTKQILWEDEKGFSSAVAAISGGAGEAKDAVVSVTNNVGSSATIYYTNEDGTFSSSVSLAIRTSTTLNLKVGAFLVIYYNRRQSQQSIPSPIVNKSGCTYKTISQNANYTSSVPNYIRLDTIVFLINDTNVTIEITT